MTNKPTPKNGSAEAQIPENAGIKVLTQYIKDLSFENPNAPDSLKGPGEGANMSVDVNVSGKPVGENVFESEIIFDATFTNKAGTLYKLELLYAGLFQFNNIEEKIAHPVLFINCPQLLFPYARQMVSSITGNAGFPPLFLEPIDFAALYTSRMKEEQARARQEKSS